MPARQVDFIEAGSGAPVILVHSSVSGARQWRRLMADLQADFLVRAVNLFGYGKTPPWSSDGAQRLEDQAALVEAALPPDAEKLCLVGHSFGGSVAMMVAAHSTRGVVLLEPKPFYLLRQAGHAAAFAEIMALRNLVKTRGPLGAWSEAAEGFADYCGGAGTWQKMPIERRQIFAEGLKPVFFEWDAVMNETLTATQWAELPRVTRSWPAIRIRCGRLRDPVCCAKPVPSGPIRRSPPADIWPRSAGRISSIPSSDPSCCPAALLRPTTCDSARSRASADFRAKSHSTQRFPQTRIISLSGS